MKATAPVLRSLLTGGDRRSIGQVPKVLALIRRHPQQFGLLVSALDDPDAIVRMRAADALEKASAPYPRLLWPYTRTLLTLAGRATQQELRWHFAQMVPRLPLDARQRRRMAALFERYLEDRSAIVRTCAMQALADLAAGDASLRPRVVAHLERLTASGTPAMRTRGRRLLAGFDHLRRPKRQVAVQPQHRRSVCC